MKLDSSTTRKAKAEKAAPETVFPTPSEMARINAKRKYDEATKGLTPAQKSASTKLRKEQVGDEVDAALRVERRQLAAAIKAAYEKSLVTVDLGRISGDDIKLVRSALHPDRVAPTEKRAKAMAIFNKLVGG